ncbi:hypothetical protein [Sphingobium lactosutens]|uniref:hypothetical protein n=1 Tax=Sphingobium lactosutens TaxID=522773 RepID=UPI001C4B58C4|nr:hypothetical protein [Sphingobium lactosutens]
MGNIVGAGLLAHAPTIILFDAHWFTTVEFCVTAQHRRTGLYAYDELPRGMC